MLLVILLLILGAALWDHFAIGGFHNNIWLVLFAGLLGATLGTSELLTRYRDEPLKSIACAAGATYILMNATLSAAVYGLLVRFSSDIFPVASSDRLLGAIIAGLGAMAVLRSRFFTVRTEAGEDVAIGPDVIASAFLNSADRSIDRQRASKRLQAVLDMTKDLKSAPATQDFFVVSISAFQNLSSAEQSGLKDQIQSIFALPSYPDFLKLQAACYAILNVAGENVLREIISGLKQLPLTAATSDPQTPGREASPIN
jgi:hypothetical protein